MPYEITFENVPAGYCVEAARGGETAKVQTIEFISEEDGDTLIERLEGFGSDILSKLPPSAQIPPGRVEHMLAIIRRDKTATVYVNELRTLGTVQPKREFAKGDAVFLDDIADVQRLAFEGVTIPKDAGVVLIFCAGWRRAMFYDLSPLQFKDPKDREYDIEAQLGQCYSYLLFQKRFKITEQVWTVLFSNQWFPFVTLKNATIKNMVSHASAGWPLDDLADAIAQEVKAAVPHLLARWRNVPAFVDHLSFLEKAAARYLDNDFISTTSIVYPRIEGLMRSHQKQADSAGQASQRGLSESAVKRALSHRHAYTPLLPNKFRHYLEAVYFATFDPKAPKIKVSRNSIGHGVAAAEECSLKSATVSLLLVDQLSYCFSGTAWQILGADRPSSTDGGTGQRNTAGSDSPEIGR